MQGGLLSQLRWELPAAMKDFTEITLCPETLDHSKVGLGFGVLPGGSLPGHLWVPAVCSPQ